MAADLTVDRANRSRLALEATYEIEHLVDIVRESIPMDYCTDKYHPRVVKNFTGRIKQLNSLVMSVLGGDDIVTTESACEIVRYESMPEAANV